MANRVELEAILKFVDVKVNPGVFNNISRAAAGMPGPVQKLNQNLNQSVTSANNVNRAVRGVNSQLTGSERAARLFLQRMAQFAILLPTFATLNKSIQGGVKFLFDFDAAIKDIIRVDIGRLAGRFDDIAKSAFALSTAFGVSAVESANTIKTYIQAGYDLVQANELARLSIMATRASTLDAGQAVEFLLSASKQFRLEGKSLTEALDGLVRAEDLSAVEARDIADAFKTGGNSLAEFGKDINDSIGLISALREQTRKSGNEIGTFFKTLQTRIFAAGESRTALESIGVSVQNLDGTLRPTLDVLNDMQTAFGKMTEAQQANAAKAIAGVRQFEELIGTLNSLTRANELSAASSNASGAAKEKEAVDATKLSRRLDDLVVAGQKLAYALGEAGGTDFFKSTLKTVTTMVEMMTSLVNLLDKMKVSALPILAPLALKAVGTVFGLGGGGAGGGSSGGGKLNPGAAGGALSGSSAQAANSMKQLSATVSQLTQVMRILMQSTMTQSQLVQSNIALDELKARSSSLNIAATNASTTAFKGTAKVWVAQKTWMQSTLPTFSKFGNAIGGAIKSTQKIENNGARFAVQYALLTLGTTAVTSGLNNLSEKLGEGFGGTLSSLTGSSVQLAGQFAILGPAAAAIAGAFAALTGIISRYAEETEKNREGFKFEAEEKSKTGRLQFAGKLLGGGEQNLGAIKFVQDWGKAVQDRTEKEINREKVLAAVYKEMDGPIKSQITSLGEMKEAFSRHEIFKKYIAAILQVDESHFKNKEALDKLRGSIDAAGNTTLSFKEFIHQFDLACGATEESVRRLSDGTIALKLSLDQMKDLQDTIAAFQEVNNLQRDIGEASKGPLEMSRGIDLLATAAVNAKSDFSNAESAFNAFLGSVTQMGASAFTNMKDATDLMSEIDKLTAVPNSGKEIESLFNKKQLTTEQLAFAREYAKIEKDKYEASLSYHKAEQDYQDEIYQNNLSNTKAVREASDQAAIALGKFRVQLAGLGVQANESGNSDLFNQATQLKGEDVAGVLRGEQSELPNAIQDVINNSFVDGLKKAERDLKLMADEFANATNPINEQINRLKEDIVGLGDAAPETYKGQEKLKKQIELTALELQKETIARDFTVKGLEAVRTLTIEQKKAQEEAAKAEADRLKKTEALTQATYEFNNAVNESSRSFKNFAKSKIDDLASKQASAYDEVKSSEQGVLSATEALSSTYRDYISTIIQVNGAIAEAKIKANLLGRDIGMLNGNIVSFQDRLGTLNEAFTSVLDDANMKLEQRIALETQLAESTLSFLQQAQDQIVSAGINIFGQSAQENQGLQKGIAGLTYVAEKLGGSFQNFLGMDNSQIDALSKELLNLPVDFRKSILDALSFLPSTTSIGGFSADQLKQAIGQVGAGVAPEEGLPAISELTAQQVEQLKILGQLGTEEAKMQLSQVIAAQKQLEKAQEQLDIAKIQEERAREGFDQVRIAVNEEMAVIEQANVERRDLLQKVIEADNANTLHDIENQAQLFADQNAHFTEVGSEIVQGIAQAINAKMSMMEAQTSLNNFNTAQSFSNQANGFIPNFANGNLSPREAAGILHAAVREKKLMPNGAQLAVANTHEAIIPMKNFAGGNAQGSEIAAGINSIRTIDQTMVAAISRSVTNSLSQLSGQGGDAQALDKIAGLLTDLNTSVGQVRDSNIAIKTNTAGLTGQTGSRTTGGVAATASQEININLQTNQNSNVQITGLENLRDQLKQALAETTNKQVAAQIEALMVQLDPVFQSLNERGIISSFGQSR